MTNNVKTKRALLGSVIALILCMAMLVGTTFAWFTDSVVSGKNQIVAGNLDVELEYYTNGKWERVNADTNVFATGTLWEPGHTEVVYLRVLNVGTLALEYSLGVKIADEIYGKNVAGEELKLSDYIEFDAVENKQNPPYGSREEARQAVAADNKTQPARLGKGYFHKGGDLYPVGNPDGKISEEYVCLVVYMPEEIGNEANYRGDAVPTIELGINLTAKQKTYEADSFGIDYDGSNGDAPTANVTDLGARTVNATVNDWGNSVQPERYNLPFVLQFEPTQSYEDATNSSYRYWHADYVIKADADVAANSVALAGYYKAFCDDYNGGNWVALQADQDIAERTEIRLVSAMGEGDIYVNYEEICKFGNDGVGFLCSAVDLTGENAGTTLTVELRIYETTADPNTGSGSKNIETGEFITVGTYTYTFQ